jgi:hypothetical protein
MEARRSTPDETPAANGHRPVADIDGDLYETRGILIGLQADFAEHKAETTKGFAGLREELRKRATPTAALGVAGLVLAKTVESLTEVATQSAAHSFPPSMLIMLAALVAMLYTQRRGGGESR